MTTIDNSKIFLGGVYADAKVKVPANTTYEVGTVLGRNADGDLTAYKSTDDTDDYTCETMYILAQTLVNTSNAAASVEIARVYDGGAVDKAKLIFALSTDATNVEVLDKLRKNHFKLENVQQLA